MTETKYLFFDIDGTLAEWRSSVTEKDLSTKGYFSSFRSSVHRSTITVYTYTQL